MFIRYRTQEEIAEAREVKLSELRDPQNYQDLFKLGKDKWLVTIGVWTHFGGIP